MSRNSVGLVSVLLSLYKENKSLYKKYGIYKRLLREMDANLLADLSRHSCFVFFKLPFMCHPDVQTLEELSLSVLSRLEEVVKEHQRWGEIAKAHIQLLRDFALQEWLCSQNLEHFYHM